jgi:two-component system OmpR family sensor kinase
VRSLTGRVVLLAIVVALASSALTTFAFTRVLGQSNRDQAGIVLAAQADSLAGAIDRRPRVADALVLKRLQNRAGYTAEQVPDGAVPTVRPFTGADVAAAVPDAAPVARAGDGVEWLVVGRPAGNGTLLMARRVAAAAQLTPVQRRRAIWGAVLGLVGGALGGLAFALSITRPLARVAAAARRLSAGERDVPLRPQGPREVADVAHALNGLSSALSTSEQRQRSFLLAVSHELRTPLTAVIGYAEGLADGALPAAEIPQVAAVVREEAGRLQRRVEDLMALARLEADDFRLVAAPADVGAVLRATATACGPRAAAQRVQLALDVPPSGPVVVIDGERLRQAVDALVDNALKVLPAGAPLVLAAFATPDGGARVEVRDGGPGLSAEDLAVAFERGVLTERYRGTRRVGSGVGLALVGELTRRMGGWAQAGQAPEGGVCFALTLPPAPPTSSPAPPP